MSENDQEKCIAADFYKFFNPTTMFNINFKNCLTIVGHYIDNLILGAYEKIENWVSKIFETILRVRQKFDREESFLGVHLSRLENGKKGARTDPAY